MRHRKAGIKLGRTGSHRNAMFRNMVTSLLKHGRIRTTETKAKELRRWADHMVTLAKRGDLHARRQALAIANEKAVVHRLFENAVQQFGSRAGGYTRLTKLGRRPGDAAPMTMVELVTEEVGGKTGKKQKKDKKQAPAKEKKQPETRSVEAEQAPEQPARDEAQETGREAPVAAEADQAAADNDDGAGQVESAPAEADDAAARSDDDTAEEKKE